ncbi:MAG TPA: methyltransferase domain-containing protein, partial [Acidimicrobiia bacterium]|nr:methyltransferase domain-containing protein [Acidimicrobiia bacterium]
MRPLTTDRGAGPAPVDGPDFSRFGAVDEAARPEEFLRFLDGVSGLASFRRLKAMMLARMEVARGHRVLDVGCGVGGDVLSLATMVAPDGLAVGLDVSEAMVAEARRRAAAAGLGAEFHLGDAADMPFPSGEFDGVRTERTLVHLPDADRAVGELRRVLRPGGRAVAFDVDFESAIIDLPDPALTRRAVTALADTYASGRIGRRLPRVFREAGFADV